MKRTSPPAASASQARPVRALAGDHQRHPGAPTAARPRCRSPSPRPAARRPARTHPRRRSGLREALVGMKFGQRDGLVRPAVPSSTQPGAVGAADDDEAVGVLEQVRLLAVQPGGVHGGLGKRSAAAQPQPGPRVGAAAAVARRRRRGRRRRSRRTAGSCAGAARVRAPAARPAASARHPNSGWTLCACTHVDADAGARVWPTSSGSSPPLSSPRAALTRAGVRARALEPSSTSWPRRRAARRCPRPCAPPRRATGSGCAAAARACAVVSVLWPRSASSRDSANVSARGGCAAHDLSDRLPDAAVRAAGRAPRRRGAVLRPRRSLRPALVQRPRRASSRRRRFRLGGSRASARRSKPGGATTP